MQDLRSMFMRYRREFLFYALAVLVVLMLPSSLAAPDGPSLALIGLLITWAAMLRPSFRTFGLRSVGRTVEMLGFGLLAFALIWFPLTHYDAVAALSGTDIAPRVAPASPSGRPTISSPEQESRVVSEIWIRHMLPPVSPSPCYTGDPSICSLADQFMSQSSAVRWNVDSYILALLTGLIPAGFCAVIVWVFTRRPEQTPTDETTGNPVAVS